MVLQLLLPLRARARACVCVDGCVRARALFSYCLASSMLPKTAQKNEISAESHIRQSMQNV